MGHELEDYCSKLILSKDDKTNMISTEVVSTKVDGHASWFCYHQYIKILCP